VSLGLTQTERIYYSLGRCGAGFACTTSTQCVSPKDTFSFSLVKLSIKSDRPNHLYKWRSLFDIYATVGSIMSSIK
ncbi:MAG: hypothetical protein ACK45T_18185, partial [Pseudanabaena sp.]